MKNKNYVENSLKEFNNKKASDKSISEEETLRILSEIICNIIITQMQENEADSIGDN